MNDQEARSKALAYVQKARRGRNVEWVLMDDLTREEDFGWVFFYNTEQYVQTRDIRWALGGNTPLIVDRRTGEVHPTGTAYSIEHYIKVYRRDGNLDRAHEA